MARNHNQFLPGLWLPAFLEQYGSKTQCRTALLGFVRKLAALGHTALKIDSCASPIKVLIYTP